MKLVPPIACARWHRLQPVCPCSTGILAGVGLKCCQCRATVIDRQLVFPAPSLAWIVMVVLPTYRAIAGVVQLSVPLAVPDPPVELDQVTAATLTLSWAVPLTTMELADVEKLLVDGETIKRDGGVESGP